MSLSEILVIYFAIGAPFAAYRFVSFKHGRSIERLIRAAITFIFWIPQLYRLLTARSRDVAIEATDEISKTRIDLEKAYAHSATTTELFELREVLDRYLELSKFRHEDDIVISDRDAAVFMVSGHGNIELAAKIGSRRNRERLKRHHLAAGRDLIESIIKSRDNSALKTKAKRLVLLADDAETMELLDTFACHNKEVCDSQDEQSLTNQTRSTNGGTLISNKV